MLTACDAPVLSAAAAVLFDKGSHWVRVSLRLTRSAGVIPGQGHWGPPSPQQPWKRHMGATSPGCPALPCRPLLPLNHASRGYLTWEGGGGGGELMGEGEGAKLLH